MAVNYPQLQYPTPQFVTPRNTIDDLARISQGYQQQQSRQQALDMQKMQLASMYEQNAAKKKEKEIEQVVTKTAADMRAAGLPAVEIYKQSRDIVAQMGGPFGMVEKFDQQAANAKKAQMDEAAQMGDFESYAKWYNIDKDQSQWITPEQAKQANTQTKFMSVGGSLVPVSQSAGGQPAIDEAGIYTPAITPYQQADLDARNRRMDLREQGATGAVQPSSFNESSYKSFGKESIRNYSKAYNSIKKVLDAPPDKKEMLLNSMSPEERASIEEVLGAPINRENLAQQLNAARTALVAEASQYAQGMTDAAAKGNLQSILPPDLRGQIMGAPGRIDYTPGQGGAISKILAARDKPKVQSAGEPGIKPANATETIIYNEDTWQPVTADNTMPPPPIPFEGQGIVPPRKSAKGRIVAATGAGVKPVEEAGTEPAQATGNENDKIIAGLAKIYRTPETPFQADVVKRSLPRLKKALDAAQSIEEKKNLSSMWLNAINSKAYDRLADAFPFLPPIDKGK